MTAHLNTIAQIWWQWMAGMFWQVSLLIILVTIIDMAIRRWAWPQVRYVLWGLIFLKLVIPPTWQMPTSIVSWIQPLVEKRISVQLQPGETLSASESTAVSKNQDNESLYGQAPVKGFVFLAWIGGMLSFSLAVIIKHSRLKRSHRSQIGQFVPERETPDWFRDLLSKTAQRLNLKKLPTVVFSQEAATPGVYGIFNPVLLLPDGYLFRLSREQVEHVLVHELCHLKRGDLVVHWLCLLLQVFYWFNPLLIWTRRQMRHVCEICCDLSVANLLRERTSAYRDTLLRTARELFTETLEPRLGFLGVFEEPFRLVPRLRWLEKKTWENRKWKSAATVCTSLVMIACVMPMSGLSQPATQTEDRVYELTDVDEPPRVIRAFPPLYPAAAKAENISGRIVVEFTVTREGLPKDEWVIDAEPPDVFEEAALEAVRQYRFSPAARNGKAVDVRVKLPIAFALGEPGTDEHFSMRYDDNDRGDTSLELSEVDTPPRILRTFPPQYPDEAKVNSIEGRVVLKFVVDTDGKAKKPEVVTAEPQGVFEEAAMKAILGYEFEPAALNGVPVACIVRLPMVFGMN